MGKNVSDERLHQHVGESFGGYEKQTDGNGNYWMEPSNDD